MQDIRSMNSSNFSNGPSSKMNSKINNIFEKKTIGTANMRQRPNQQGGITQFCTNQSSSLQSPIPFRSVDSNQNTQNRNGNQTNHISKKNNVMIKPGFLNQSSQQNIRISNNSCINIPYSSPMNQINPNHSLINLFETSQIQIRSKQQSIENSNYRKNQNSQQNNLLYLNNSQSNIQQNSQQSNCNNFQNNVQYINSQINGNKQQQNNNIQYGNYSSTKQQQVSTLHVKSNYQKHPNTPQMRGSGGSQSLINQEKRFSEQFHSESNSKIVKLVTQQQSQDEMSPQSSQINLMQSLTQNSNKTTNQSSTRVIQKMRYNNSASMIRLRSSQDSFFDTILDSDNNYIQSRSMQQTKKKKKGKKLRTGSPTCSDSRTVATQSQLISSTNRMNSIPSPLLLHSSFNTQTINNSSSNLLFKTSYSMIQNKIDLQKIQTSTLQNDLSSQFFSKLKKKKMLFFQSNAKGFPSKIETQQDMNKQQLQHIHSSYDSSPNYHIWLSQQNQQQNSFQSQNQSQVLSPTLKHIYTSFAQSYTPSSQQINSQKQFYDNNTSTLNLNSCTSKTHSLLDKLNKLNKYSQKNQSQFSHIQDKVSQNIIQSESNNNIQETAFQKEDKQKEDINNEKVEIKIDYRDYKNENVDFGNNEFDQSIKDQQIQYLQKFNELLNNKNTSIQCSPLLQPLISSEQKSEKFFIDQVPELEEQISQQIFNKSFQIAQSIHDIPLPSQALKNQQYQQYENILLGFQKSCQQSKDIEMQQFLDYLITFSKRYIKPIPQIVRNSQHISSQYKKKDEECNRLKQEKLNLLIEKNKHQDKESPQFIQNQQYQEQTLKELHTPSTQIEDNSYQGLIAEQQMQISNLKRQLEEKNTVIQNMNNTYLEHLQTQEKHWEQEAFNFQSQEVEEEICNLKIQDQIESTNLELEQRYNQSLSIKSKSTSNLNENIRSKLKLDFSALKGNSNNSTNKQTKPLGLNLNNISQNTEQLKCNQNTDQGQNQVMDYYDEFMSKIDEFSLSWRKAVIDESQKYQNRDNPLKKQQLMNEHKQQQQNQ